MERETEQSMGNWSAGVGVSCKFYKDRQGGPPWGLKGDGGVKS